MKKQILLLIAMITCLCTFAQIPTTGLIAYYPMGIPYSTVSPLSAHADASGNGYNLTVTSGFGHGAGRSAVSGEAAEYNGSNADQRRYDYSGAQAAFQQTGNFTISAWVRLGSPFLNEYETVVQVGDNDIFLRFRHDGNQNYFIQGGYRTGATSFSVVTNLITQNNYFNTWRFITLTRNAGSTNVYEGNTLIATSGNGGATGVFSAGDKLFKVGYSNITNNGFNGRIQDVFYYNRAINSTELAQLACSATPPVNITANLNPYQNICPGTSVQLQAQATPNTNPIKWYTVPVGGTLFHTGSALNLGPVNSSVTYYVDATASNGCVSYARVPIAVTVVAVPAAPTNTSNPANLTVCSGNTTTLIATGANVTWYAGPSGGASIGSGNSFVTPAITGNVTYYVQDGVGSCASARTPIAVTLASSATPATPVNTTVSFNQTRCGNSTSTLSVSGTGTINWYNTATGGTSLGTGTSFTTPALANPPSPAATSTVTYYAEASSGCASSARLAIPITVKYQYSFTNTTPVANLTVCSGSTTTLSITTNAPTIEWAESAGGISGPVLGTAATFITPSISSATTFLAFASGNSTLTCNAGEFITVNVTSPPAAPTNTTAAGNLTLCPGAATTLTATGSATLQWFSVPTGGSVLGTGGSFSTPAINANTTYYVQSSTGSCSSPRTAILITTIAAPPVPVNNTPAANSGICTGNSTTLSVNPPASGTNMYWFADSIGFPALTVGNSYTTPVLNSTTSYWVSAVNASNCGSARVKITVNVSPIPASPIITGGATLVCQGSTTTITASGAGTLEWFATLNGGSPLATGTSYTTPPINSLSEYYVQSTVNGCKSARVGVGISVNGLPAAPISTTSAANLNRCAVGTTTLSANNVSLTTLRWYASPTSDTILATGTTFTTPILSTTTTFYVARFGQCESARTAITVNVGATPTDITPAANLSICSGTTTTLSVSGNDIKWYAAATTGTAVDSGSTFTTPVLTTNTTYHAQGGGCATRRAITVTVTPVTPSPPNTTPIADLTICSGSTTTIIATVSVCCANYFISDSITGGSILALGGTVGVSYTTPPLFTTTTYYAGANYGSACAAPRTPITITVTGSSPGTLSGIQSICLGSTTPFSSTVSGGTWSTSNANIASVSASGVVSGNALGNATITYTAAGTVACPNPVSTTRTVTVTAGITASISPATATICAGQTATLTASGGGTYAWSNAGGSAAAATFTPAGTTTYTVTVSQGNCSATATRTVNVNANPTAAITPATATICAGASTTLTASGGTSYIWSNGGGNTAAATFSPATTTTYTVTVSNASNCTATATRSVTVNAVPTAAINPATASICTGASQSLTASGGGTYAWSNSLGTGATKSVTPLATTTYTVTVTNANNCSATAASTITANTVTAAINGPSTICAGTSATLTASGGSTAPTYAWSNSLGSGSSKTVTPIQTTTYTVTVTGAGNCTATASQTVSVQTAPTATITGATSVCSGSSVTLTANGGNTYTWANGLGSNTAINVSPTTNTTYTVTVSIGANCTATATQTVSIKQPTTGTQNQTICQGKTVSFNGQQLAQSGTYRDTLVNAAGCDSILTLNLTVTPALQGSFAQTICTGKTFSFNGQTLAQSGAYRDTLQTTGGCDSIVTLNLTVTPALQGSFSQTICFGDSYSFNGQTLAQSGTFKDTLQTSGGCDSIITLNLTALNKIENVINAGICTGQSYSFKGQSLTQTGQYFDTLQTTLGCDSFVTLNLSVNSFVTGSFNKAICQGESFTFNGQALTQNGQFLDTLISSGGCDSILTLTLSVNTLPQPSVTVNNVDLSTEQFESYQWLFNGSEIQGANQQTYTATQNGDYSVNVIDNNGCESLSDAVNVTIVGVVNYDVRFKIYPNPTSRIMNIETSSNNVTINVITMEGKTVMTEAISKIATVDMAALAHGMYIIEVKTENSINRTRIVKE